jgi:tRNA (adenine22-N1)-methyltransferase
MRLSTRLEFIYQTLIPGHDVWDICCDHGRIGLKALGDGRFSTIYFVDQVPHIIERLQNKLNNLAKFQEKLVMARFHALPAQEISEKMKGNIVIAGIGGLTIVEILEKRTRKYGIEPRRLILAPQDHWQDLQDHLIENGLGHFQMTELLERNRTRRIFVLDF